MAKFGKCSICGLHSIIYGIPTYNVCKNCLPKWHAIQVEKFLEFSKGKFWRR